MSYVGSVNNMSVDSILSNNQLLSSNSQMDQSLVNSQWINQPGLINQSNIHPYSYFCALLGLAETFRTMTPPNIRLCIHCLKSILFFKKLPANLEARTSLDLGKILFRYSRSEDQIKLYLEKARTLGAHLKAPDDVIKFEAADLLSEFLESLGKRKEAICVLEDALRLSKCNSYWHCRLLLRLASAFVAEKDTEKACEVLSIGSEFAKSCVEPDYTKGLFLLSKCMLLLPERRSDASNCLTVAGNLLDQFHGPPFLQESLRSMWLLLQVSQYLLAGRVKSSKSALKKLHTCIQELVVLDEDSGGTVSISETGGPTIPLSSRVQFLWFPREQMVVLVYMASAQHAMLSGHLERALRYVEKAEHQLEKLLSPSSEDLHNHAVNPTFSGHYGGGGALNSPSQQQLVLLTGFRFCVLEWAAQCRLVAGRKYEAVRDIGTALRLLHQPSSHNNQMAATISGKIRKKKSGVLHALLGLYAMSMNQMNCAETQLRYSLHIQGQQSQSRAENSVGALRVFVILNLAIVLTRLGRFDEAQALIDSIPGLASTNLSGTATSSNNEDKHKPGNLNANLASWGEGLHAAWYYVKGFLLFVRERHQEAYHALKSGLKVANDEDLQRLTTICLMTMGQISMTRGTVELANGQDRNSENVKKNLKECKDTIEPVLDFANRIPDIGVQLWVTALQKDLHQMEGECDGETKWFQQHKQFSQKVISDHTAANRHFYHQLIHWTDGPPPLENAPSQYSVSGNVSTILAAAGGGGGPNNDKSSGSVTSNMLLQQYQPPQQQFSSQQPHFN